MLFIQLLFLLHRSSIPLLAKQLKRNKILGLLYLSKGMYLKELHRHCWKIIGFHLVKITIVYSTQILFLYNSTKLTYRKCTRECYHFGSIVLVNQILNSSMQVLAFAQVAIFLIQMMGLKERKWPHLSVLLLRCSSTKWQPVEHPTTPSLAVKISLLALGSIFSLPRSGLILFDYWLLWLEIHTCAVFIQRNEGYFLLLDLNSSS